MAQRGSGCHRGVQFRNIYPLSAVLLLQWDVGSSEEGTDEADVADHGDGRGDEEGDEAE